MGREFDSRLWHTPERNRSGVSFLRSPSARGNPVYARLQYSEVWESSGLRGRMYRRIRAWIAALSYALIGVTVVGVAAQPATCPALVARAMQSVGDNCGAMPRNSMCYGFNRVDATFFQTVDDDFFSAPADRAPLTDVAAVQTAPLDEALEQWGIALLNVQANVPNTLPGQAVTFILLGDTRVENAVEPDAAFEAADPVRVAVTAGGRVNVRSGPGTTFNVSSTADPGQLFDVDARNEAGDWLRVAGQAPYEWIFADLVSPQEGPRAQFNDLPVAPESPVSPMQAFYFRTGIGRPACEEAPDLLVIQGPQEVRVALNVNGAEVELGSTIALKSSELPFGTLMGDGSVRPVLQNADLPENFACLLTEITILEGDMLANGGAMFVPLGHQSKSVTCLNEERQPLFTTEFTQPQIVEDFTPFQILEQFPFPRYPLTLPSPEEIQQSIQNGPSVKPTPTRLPRIAPIVPAQATSSGPRPTSVPGQQATPAPTPDPNQPSCAGFNLIGPGQQVDPYNQLFAWTPATNVAGYQLAIQAIDYSGNIVSGSLKLYRVGATETGIYAAIARDLGEFVPESIRWVIQALVNDASGNLVTLCELGPYKSQLVWSN